MTGAVRKATVSLTGAVRVRVPGRGTGRCGERVRVQDRETGAERCRARVRGSVRVPVRLRARRQVRDRDTGRRPRTVLERVRKGVREKGR